VADHRTNLALTVDGKAHVVSASPGKPLVDVLRDDLGLRGTHVGCRNGDCGACTVLIEGAAYKSCLVPCHRASGKRVETLEGLAREGELHPVQRAFWEHNAFQCGFCLSGQVLCTVEVLRAQPHPEKAAIIEALAGNLCRCTGYQQILHAACVAAGVDLKSEPDCASEPTFKSAAHEKLMTTPAASSDTTRSINPVNGKLVAE
jgi:aerobic-type carbon monoxide dehydrogenase small subunit (CoxS/CutS family)